MNVQDLNDNILHADIKKIAQIERDMTLKVINYLREIDRRRLFSKWGFKSLHEFATKELCYSDGQAGRRIQAMKGLIEFPELEKKISNGTVSLTNVAMAQTFFNHEQKHLSRALTLDEKSEVLLQIENKSTREAEMVFVQRSSNPATLFADRVRPINAEYSAMNHPVQNLVLDKLAQIKGLLAHKLPNPNQNELLNEICDMVLAQLLPTAPIKQRSKKAKQNTEVPEQKISSEVSEAKFAGGKSSRNRKAIPAAVRRAVWQRDHSKCTNCKSTYALQPDHIIPRAKGGANTLQNLRLLCRNCNQRAAIEHFGNAKMAGFLNKPRER